MPRYEHLDHGDKLKYRRGILQNHERRVSLEVQTLGGDPQRRLELIAFEGQVDCSRPSKDDVSRVLSLRAADPRQVLNFDSASPGEGIFFDRLLQVHDDRYIPSLSDWVTHTPFTGPLWSFKRTGSIVELTAHDKARLSMGNQWEPYNLHKGWRKTDEIVNILQATGEDRFAIPTLSGKVPEKKGLDRFASPWEHAFRLAESLNRQLLYTGPGVATLRRLPEALSFTFEDGEGGSVLTEPEIDRTLEGLANIIIVRGKKPRGNNSRPYAVVRLPPAHPLSSRSLGRNGRPRYLVADIENEACRTATECAAFGQRELKDRLRAVVNASFDAPPIPIIEPGDLGKLVLDDGELRWRIWDHTLPLAGGNMTVGSLRRARPTRMRSTRHPSHHVAKKHKGKGNK